MMRQLTIFLSLVIACCLINAMQFNADAALITTTRYADCQRRADKIVELTNRWIKANSEQQTALQAEIEKQKKKLKKCERRNRRRHVNFDRVSVGATFTF